MKVAAAFLTMLASTVISLVICEALYRIVLSQTVPERFRYSEEAVIGVYDKSHWVFDRQLGYGYPPGQKMQFALLVDGKVAGCGLIDTINERGNIGPIEGSYEDAELKILLVGDSWSAFVQNGLTWTDMLERRLEERTGKTVDVANFSRDGYGILQMFDMAAAKVPEWKPDLVVVAFITNDLARVRTWRAVLQKGGVDDRILTTFEPNETPDMEKSYDTVIVHHEATGEWCDQARRTGQRDHVIEAVLDKYQRANRVGGLKVPSIYTLKSSYLLNRVRYGDPFKGTQETFGFPQVSLQSYMEDDGFRQALATLKESGIPVVLYHMAFYPEVVAGSEYITNYQEQSLLESLYESTEFTKVETLEHVELPVEKPERMNKSPDNYHPSAWGMEFYTDAFVRALLDRGLLDKLVPGAASWDKTEN